MTQILFYPEWVVGEVLQSPTPIPAAAVAPGDLESHEFRGKLSLDVISEDFVDVRDPHPVLSTKLSSETEGAP